MENLIFALDATMPVFLVIVFGKFLMKIGIINESWTKVTDKFAFRVALPFTLFLDIAKMRVDEESNIKFIIFCLVVTVIMFMGVWLLAFLFLKDKSKVGSFTQGASRGSAAILGLPFAMNTYGHAGLVPLMILTVVPLFNAFSVIILAVSANLNKEGGSDRVKVDLKAVLKSIITNPLIVGIACGFPFCIFGIKLPFILSHSVNQVGLTATGLMLISIGANFHMSDLKSMFKYSFIATLIKTVALPAIFIPFAVFFGFTREHLIAILIMLGSPSAISGHVMAKSMGNDEVLMSNIIVMTTLISAVTFTFFIFILKSFSLL